MVSEYFSTEYSMMHMDLCSASIFNSTARFITNWQIVDTVDRNMKNTNNNSASFIPLSGILNSF